MRVALRTPRHAYQIIYSLCTPVAPLRRVPLEEFPSLRDTFDCLPGVVLEAVRPIAILDARSEAVRELPPPSVPGRWRTLLQRPIVLVLTVRFYSNDMLRAALPTLCTDTFHCKVAERPLPAMTGLGTGYDANLEYLLCYTTVEAWNQPHAWRSCWPADTWE